VRALPPQARQVTAFLVVGGLSAAVDAGVFFALVFFGVPPVIASSLSFLSAFVINYRGNRDVVFRAKQGRGIFVRYCLLVAVNLGLSAAGVAFGIWIGLSAALSKILTMVVVAGVNFIAMRLWVFPSAEDTER